MSKKKVLVALSGGVDSSVAAALLVNKGYTVVGAYMKNFSHERWKGIIDKNCPWETDIKDAKKVCEILGIEFYCFNFEKEYEKKVIDYFFKEYNVGRTPNPDIKCNKEIKFNLFLKKAREMSFDYIATGHYVQIQKSKLKSQNHNLKSKTDLKLLKGKDVHKDQSYFLYTLTQKQLSRTLFPIGKYTKPQVRVLARKFGLPNAEKKDSQGICFIGHIRLSNFLKQRIKEKTGLIIDTNKNILGKHQGVWNYTPGQRHGLGIGGGVPYYVVDKNIKTNTLIVACGIKHPQLYKKEIFVKNIHWILNKPLIPFSCSAKIRYRQKDQRCIIKKSETGYKIIFPKSQFAPARGQAIVFYKKKVMLGGGIIERII